MQKKIRMSTITGGIAALAAGATLLLAGCGTFDETETTDSVQTAAVEPADQEMQWSAVHSSLPEQYEMATVDGDHIYACRYGDEGLIVSTFAAENAELTDSYVIPDVTEVKSLSVNASNEICLFCTMNEKDTFLKIASGGEISSIEDIQVEDLGLYATLKNVYTDSNGYTYLWYGMSVLSAEVYEDAGDDIYYTALDRIYIKDQEMNTVIYEQVPDSFGNKLLSFAFDEAGQPVILAKDEEGYYTRRVRTAEGKEYEPQRIETAELTDLENSGTITFAQDGLLYTSYGALYFYDLADASNEKVMELAGAGILEDDIIYLGLKDDSIEIIDNYKDFDHSEYTVISEGETERKQLTLGVMELQPEMKEIIASFNRYQNEITIEPIVYAEDYDYEQGCERLTLDIIQGKAPDLISTDGIAYENLANAGAFTDLYMFMQEDAEVNVDSLVSSVLAAYEMDGHLYTIAPAFRIYTMWGAESVVNGQNGVNLDEMIQILEEHGGDINSIHGFSADESPLTTLCTFGMDKFINWQEGTCDFTGAEFRQVLNFVKNYEGQAIGSFYQAIRNQDILLEMGLINSVEDYRLQCELFGEAIQFIGYPTESGTGIAALLAGDDLTINAKSAYQQEAWEFIKYYIQNGYDGLGFPIEKEQFDAVLDTSLEETMVNENGEMTACAKTSYSEPDIVSINVFKCEQGDVDAIRKMVDQVSSKFQYNTAIQNIIDEEAESYLQGQKSIDDVCTIIQSRVQLYLDETN